MSDKQNQENNPKHSKERREFLKTASPLILLTYLSPVIKTFNIDRGLDNPTPQGANIKVNAARQARQAGLRGQALVQAVQNLISP